MSFRLARSVGRSSCRVQTQSVQFSNVGGSRSHTVNGHLDLHIVRLDPPGMFQLVCAEVAIKKLHVLQGGGISQAAVESPEDGFDVPPTYIP